MHGNLKMNNKKAEVFFNVFGGEFVEIVHTLEVPLSIEVEEGHTHDIKVPLTLNGFVMDVADGWVFLSPDGENVNQAVPLGDVRHIAIIDVTEEPEETFPEPSNKNFN